MPKTARDYQLKHRAGLPKVNGRRRRSIISDYSILCAWAYGDLTEGQASEMLKVDRIEARKMLLDARSYATNAWMDFRKENPIVWEKVAK